MERTGTIFEAIGGQITVDKIVDSLYTHIGVNKKLLEIFPEDLEESARKQRLFLTQFFGGPAIYSEERGAPMLRMRHLPFEITPSRAREWLNCMDIALDEANIEEPYRSAIFERLKAPAAHMINTDEGSN